MYILSDRAIGLIGFSHYFYAVHKPVSPKQKVLIDHKVVNGKCKCRSIDNKKATRNRVAVSISSLLFHFQFQQRLFFHEAFDFIAYYQLTNSRRSTGKNEVANVHGKIVGDIRNNIIKAVGHLFR